MSKRFYAPFSEWEDYRDGMFGSEVYSPVSMGRKAIGVELKDSYFKQAILNLKHAEKRYKQRVKQEKMF